MPGQGRLGDKAKAQIDVHGCPACPHPTIGPAIQGSPDVNVNGRPALRMNDPGIHTACCGLNTWNAAAGCGTVFINNKQAHRLNDATKHCGGPGQLIEGSPNVIVGESGAGSSSGGGAGGGGGGAGDGPSPPAAALASPPSAPPAAALASPPSAPPAAAKPDPQVMLAQWSTDQAGPNDEVEMTVYTQDHPPGTPLAVVVKTRDGDDVVQTVQAEVTGDTTSVPWKYHHDSHGGADESDRPADRLTDYYFEATVAGTTKTSGLLAIRTTVQILVKDNTGRAVRFARYTAKLVGGRMVEGETDEHGVATLADVPPGSMHIKLLDHKAIEFDT